MKNENSVIPIFVYHLKDYLTKGNKGHMKIVDAVLYIDKKEKLRVEHTL